MSSPRLMESVGKEGREDTLGRGNKGRAWAQAGNADQLNLEGARWE